MRVTVSLPVVDLRELTEIVEQLKAKHAAVEVTSEGQTANFDGDPLAFVSLAVHILRDVGVGVIAAYLYDLSRRPGRSVKVEGRSIETSTIEEIRICSSRLEHGLAA